MLKKKNETAKIPQSTQSTQSISLCARLEAPTFGCGLVVSVFSVVNVYQ